MPWWRRLWLQRLAATSFPSAAAVWLTVGTVGAVLLLLSLLLTYLNSAHHGLLRQLVTSHDSLLLQRRGGEQRGSRPPLWLASARVETLVQTHQTRLQHRKPERPEPPSSSLLPAARLPVTAPPLLSGPLPPAVRIGNGSDMQVRVREVVEYELDIPPLWDVVISMRAETLWLPLVSYHRDGKWHALVYSEDAGDFELHVRVTEQEPRSTYKEPDDCMKAASMVDETLELWSRHSPWLVDLRRQCPGWKKPDIWVNASLGFISWQQLPLNVLVQDSTLWTCSIRVREMDAAAAAAAAAAARPASSQHRHALADFLAARGGVESESSYGRWVRHATGDFPPGHVYYTPRVRDCPRMVRRKQEHCESSISQWTWKWLPFGFASREQWLLPPDELRRCALRERLFVQGDSVAAATSDSMVCVTQTWALKSRTENQLAEMAVGMGRLGQLLPLQFFDSRVPPNYTVSVSDYDYLMPNRDVPANLSTGPWNITAINADETARLHGTKVWLVGAWMMSFLNMSRWHSGLHFMAQRMLQSPSRSVFVLTTEVHPHITEPGMVTSVGYQTPRRMRQWIDTARLVMRQYGIQLVDLYTPSTVRTDERMDSVHYCPYMVSELAHIMWREICDRGQQLASASPVWFEPASPDGV